MTNKATWLMLLNKSVLAIQESFPLSLQNSVKIEKLLENIHLFPKFEPIHNAVDAKPVGLLY